MQVNSSAMMVCGNRELLGNVRCLSQPWQLVLGAGLGAVCLVLAWKLSLVALGLPGMQLWKTLS